LDENGTILSDPEVVNKELIKTLKQLQINANYPAYKKPVEFPRLPPLSLAECECILKQISQGRLSL